eukprot:876854_1
MTVMIVYILIQLLLITHSLKWDCPTDTTACLPGGKHKSNASPEDSTYAACLNYKDSSCCTSDFTQQLATSTVEVIQDGDTVFDWTHCGPISESCEQYFIEIECMYRCDPNMIFFAGEFASSLNRVPICSQYCDHWYEACKADATCVTNWILDPNTYQSPWETEIDNSTGTPLTVNTCPANSKCDTFETRYGNGEQLCNVLWHETFNYTAEDDLCYTPNKYKANTLITEEIFADKCSLTRAIDSPDNVKWDCPNDASECLSGGKHKEKPSPEDSTYAACLNYKDSSCCTADFTQQLAASTVTYIQDGDEIFNWTHCGGMSESCEQYFIEIECMYRCDPNMIYFAGEYPSSLNRVPICSQYCDHWYEACKADLTCVENWIFEFIRDKDNNNVCPSESVCDTFENTYGNGQQLCNVLWGNTFNYTAENDLCLTPNANAANTLVVDTLFSKKCPPTISPTISPSNQPTDNPIESGEDDGEDTAGNGISLAVYVNMIIGHIVLFVLCGF